MGNTISTYSTSESTTIVKENINELYDLGYKRYHEKSFGEMYKSKDQAITNLITHMIEKNDYEVKVSHDSEGYIQEPIQFCKSGKCQLLSTIPHDFYRTLGRHGGYVTYKLENVRGEFKFAHISNVRDHMEIWDKLDKL